MTRAASLAALVRAAHRRIADARLLPAFGTPMKVLLKREGWLV